MSRYPRFRYSIRALLLVMFVGALCAWYFRTLYLNRSYFPLAVGDRWVYASLGESADVVFEVIGTESVEGTECFVVERTIGKHTVNFYMSVQMDGARLHRVGDDVYRPPYRQFAFPTKDKDGWTWAGAIGKQPFEYNCRNGGLQHVNVPHGSHQAFVVMQSTESGEWANFWLVQGVGVVKIDGKFSDQHDPQGSPGARQKFNWQLKKFTRGGSRRK